MSGEQDREALIARLRWEFWLPENGGQWPRIVDALMRSPEMADHDRRVRASALREAEARIDGDPTLRLGHNVSVVCSCLRCDVVHGAIRVVRDMRTEAKP